ncbi:acyl-CoA dehydrogenase family protein [Actinocorallia longicatena]|uniref:Acyl-CoA dehydrogenase n=1 Tax=Actinocorallia longicatena TaxID=111803 RepID=A0ABP6Q111_9ACTN
MRFAFTSDQRLLAATVAETLQKACPPSLVRAARTDPEIRRGEAWAALAELGLLGATVPESAGGLGFTPLDTVLAWEEIGRACVPGPLVETAVVAPLLAGGEWPARIAAGRAAVSVRCLENPYLLDADVADLLLLPEAGTPGLTELRSGDATRRLFSAAGETASAGTAADHAAVAVAAQLLGLSRWLTATAVAYAGQRRQFGKVIGTFQALKHQLANVAIKVEFATPVVHRAAYSLTHDLPTAGRDASAAKVAAGEAAHLAARTALQVHGGIGYTDELDLFLWLSRVWALRASWGDERLHRARIREALLA